MNKRTDGKTLLMIGAGIEAVPGIEMAKARGLRVVVSDMNPEAPGAAVSDYAIMASTYDVKETVAAVRSYAKREGDIHGVMSLATDVPHTVSAVAEALGLPGLPRDVAGLAIDKLAMKQRFAKDGVPIPWFSAVKSPGQLRDIARSRGLPLVLKPVDSRGGRGVLRLTPNVDLDWAFRESRSHSPSDRVMVEEYLDGPQVSTESIILNRRAYTPGFSDRNYELLEKYAPNFIENGGELPSRLPPAQQAQVRVLVERAALSMGIDNWVAKGDIVVHRGEPKVIEMAARLSGGYFATHEIPLNVGVSTLDAVISLALGEPVDPASLEPKFSRHVVQRYAFAPTGTLRNMTNVDAIRSMPGVEKLAVKGRPGDVIERPTDSNAAVAMIIACGDSREQAIQRAGAAVDALQLEVTP